VGLVDDPAAASGGARVGGEQLLAGAEREDGDLGRGDAQLDPAAGADPPPGHRVVAGRKRDQGVLADPAGVPVTDHVRLGGERTQRGPVAFGADPDDLAVGAVDLRATDR
jgi:hypothetical protein